MITWGQMIFLGAAILLGALVIASGFITISNGLRDIATALRQSLPPQYGIDQSIILPDQFEEPS